MSTTQHSTIKNIARAGLTAKGVVYFGLGLLALFSAAGMGKDAGGQRQVLDWLQEQPFGNVLLGLLALGLFSYTVWRYIRAIKDPDNDGSDTEGMVKRAAYMISGTFYAALGVVAITMIFGSGSSGGSGDKKSSAIAMLLDLPGGRFIVGALALIFVGVAIAQAMKGYKAKFVQLADTSDMDEKTRRAFKNSGRLGHYARAVVFGIIAYFLGRAALESNPDAVRGTGGAIEFVQSQGSIWLLGAMAVGLMLYGTFALILAQYRKVE